MQFNLNIPLELYIAMFELDQPYQLFIQVKIWKSIQISFKIILDLFLNNLNS